MKRSTFIIVIILLISISACRGPLAKPGDDQKSIAKEESKSPGSMRMQNVATNRENVSIEMPEGGITIADLMANREKYDKKTVKVKGKVTKVNPDIMGKNWIHIQDGTGTADLYELTITSDMLPSLGSIVTMEGNIALEKDFGYGYKYPVIMEDGRVTE